NLLAEGIDPGAVYVCGNTVVDAVESLREKIDQSSLPVRVPLGQRMMLVTLHRRENLGEPLANVCRALCRLTLECPDLHILFLTHPNPAASGRARALLCGHDRISLLPPHGYVETLRLVSSSWLILTDSGGLQEEAPSFGRPVLVLRDHTERVEGLACQAARLVGTDS